MVISFSTKKQRKSLIMVTANFINEENAIASSQAPHFHHTLCVYDLTSRGSKSQLDKNFLAEHLSYLKPPPPHNAYMSPCPLLPSALSSSMNWQEKEEEEGKTNQKPNWHLSVASLEVKSQIFRVGLPIKDLF